MKPFRLVKEQVSDDTIQALAALHTLASRGEIIGIAYAVMLKGRMVVVNTTGEARRSPIFARGMVAQLDDAVSDLVREDGKE
jgi:hypothetical protein